MGLLLHTTVFMYRQPSGTYIQATVELCGPCSLPPIGESVSQSLTCFGEEQQG